MLVKKDFKFRKLYKAKKECKLDNKVMAVYSYLLYRTGYDKTASNRSLRLSTNLGKTVVKRAIKELIELKLIEPVHQGKRIKYKTTSTTPEFLVLTKDATRPQYISLFVPANCADLSFNDCLVYSLLFSPITKSIASLARIAGLKWDTAKSCLITLQDLGLMDDYYQPKLSQEHFLLKGDKRFSLKPELFNQHGVPLLGDWLKENCSNIVIKGTEVFNYRSTDDLVFDYNNITRNLLKEVSKTEVLKFYNSASKFSQFYKLDPKEINRMIGYCERKKANLSKVMSTYFN